MNRFFVVLSLIILLASCKNTPTSTNKFSDPVLVKIGTWQDHRAADSLLTFFSHENPVYRKEAVLAFASLQDSAAVDKLGEVLSTDADTTVRKAAAFSLGQTTSDRSANILATAFGKERDDKVQAVILEAYGKVTKHWDLDISPDEKNESGLAWSLYRAGLRNAVDESYHAMAASLLERGHRDQTRLGAAHFFARSAKNFEAYSSVIRSAAEKDPDVNVRMAAALALRKIKTDSSFMSLEKILKTEEDYRVRVNAIRALQAFPFEKTKEYLLEALRDKYTNVGVAASEVIIEKVTPDFWIPLANMVTNIRNPRIQANIYQAILAVTENQSVIKEIKATYQRSKNPYQKAALLTALQASVNEYDFIENELLKADTPVVRSSAASALVAINYNDKFQPSWQNHFADLYIKAMKTGDLAVTGIFAGALADPALGYKKVIEDFSFLYEAKKKFSLPKDNEALQSLESAIAYFENKPSPSPVINEYNHPIDWSLVKSIPEGQRVMIRTTRGNITIRLLVNEAPGSVANFVILARRHYFDKKFFHRVVPNFVIQAGCNRGDGWGSEDYSIRSEFSQKRYITGSVGMASAGKDTEGTQWFITHSPTPHLDGRYTIFAEVESGMDAVHRMEVGDQILSVEIMGNN